MSLPDVAPPRRATIDEEEVLGRVPPPASSTAAAAATPSAADHPTDDAPRGTLHSSLLSPRYFRRIGIDDPTTLDEAPTFDKLKILQERHLASVPFENLSQHGLDLPATLDVEATAHKILDRNRGGFCFEVNGLFGALLVELGYRVVMLPAQLYHGTQFAVPTHLVLIVTCQDGTRAFVDVGFGEPPLHPLRYDDDVSSSSSSSSTIFDRVQVTPEGMRSKLVRHPDDDQGDAVYLYWHKDGQWVPRLRWSYPQSIGAEGTTPMALQDFHPYLRTVRQPDSNFSKKLICCVLTKDRKISLAGNRLKVTGHPRFPEGDDDEKAPVVTVEVLPTVEAVRKALADHFGIPLVESATIDLTTSLATDAAVWSHM